MSFIPAPSKLKMNVFVLEKFLILSYFSVVVVPDETSTVSVEMLVGVLVVKIPSFADIYSLLTRRSDSG